MPLQGYALRWQFLPPSSPPAARASAPGCRLELAWQMQPVPTKSRPEPKNGVTAMNKLLLLGLIGGGVYWLFRESARQPEYLDDFEAEEASQDFRDVLTGADHEQELLDEALAESFPASDPPSISR
jgi:hypothetical protein